MERELRLRPLRSLYRRVYVPLGRFIGNNMMWLSVVMLLVGITFPQVVGRATPIVPLIFAFMTFQSSLSNHLRHVVDALRHPLVMLVTLALSAVLVPSLAFVLARLVFGSHPDLVAGLVLEYCVPIAVVSIMWVNLFRGNAAVALATLLVSTVLSPVTIPLTLKVLLGQTVQVDAAGMMQTMLLTIALPALLGVLLNDMTKGWAARRLSPALAPAARMVLCAVICINSVRIEPYLHHLTPLYIAVTVFVGLFAISGYVWGLVAGRMLKRDAGTVVSLTYLVGMRNISAGAVLAAAYFPPEVMFPVMIGTLFQQVIAGAFGAYFRHSYPEISAAQARENRAAAHATIKERGR